MLKCQTYFFIKFSDGLFFNVGDPDFDTGGRVGQIWRQACNIYRAYKKISGRVHIYYDKYIGSLL